MICAGCFLCAQAPGDDVVVFINFAGTLKWHYGNKNSKPFRQPPAGI